MTSTATAPLRTDAQVEAAVRHLLAEATGRSALPAWAAPSHERAVSAIAEEVGELLGTLAARR